MSYTLNTLRPLTRRQYAHHAVFAADDRTFLLSIVRVIVKSRPYCNFHLYSTVEYVRTTYQIEKGRGGELLDCEEIQMYQQHAR